MKGLVLIFLAACCLTACKPSDKEFVKIGEDVVRQGLKDPDSAKFESNYKPSGDNDGHVCGRVNAKNSYGGYTGYKNFYVYINTKDGKLVDHGPVKIADNEDEEAQANFQTICQ